MPSGYSCTSKWFKTFHCSFHCLNKSGDKLLKAYVTEGGLGLSVALYCVSKFRMTFRVTFGDVSGIQILRIEDEFFSILNAAFSVCCHVHRH